MQHFLVHTVDWENWDYPYRLSQYIQILVEEQTPAEFVAGWQKELTMGARVSR